MKPPIPTRSRRTLSLALAGLLLTLPSFTASAVLYYDTDTGTAGLQGAAGNWTVTAGTNNSTWNPASDGSGTAQTWANGESAVFDSAGSYTVTAIGTPLAGNVTFAQGNVTISGTIQLGLGGNLSAASTAGNTVLGTVQLQTGADSTRHFTNDSSAGTLTIASITRATANATHPVVFGGSGNITVTNLQNLASGSITKNGAGTLTLNGRSNQANQAVSVNGGVLNLGTSTHLTIATGNTALTLNGGTLRTNHDRATGIGSALHGITLGANGGTIEPTGVTTFTQPGQVVGVGNLTKAGSGTLVLSNASNTFTGNTIVAAGNLSATGANSLTTSSGYYVTGGSANSAALSIGSAQDFTTKTVNITASGGGIYRKDLAGSAAYTTYGASLSSFAGGNPDTTAQFLAGSAGGDRSLLTSFSATTLVAVSNDANRISDVFSLSGTVDDIFVLQLNVTGIDANSYLAWNNSGTWANATAGNIGPLGGSAVTGFAGSFALSGAAATSNYLGSWGYDTGNNTVWAVIDHNSEFAVATIPEPHVGLMFLGGFGLLGLLRRRS